MIRTKPLNMKKQNLIFLGLLSILTLGACSKYLGTTSNLAGSWDVYAVKQNYYTNGSLDSSNVQNNQGSFTFDAAGTGTYSVQNNDQTSSGSFDWFEKNNKVFINMTNFSDSIMTKNMAIGFDVITNTATQQVWSLTYSYYQSDQAPSGATVKYLKKNYLEFDLRKQ